MRAMPRTRRRRILVWAGSRIDRRRRLTCGLCQSPEHSRATRKKCHPERSLQRHLPSQRKKSLQAKGRHWPRQTLSVAEGIQYGRVYPGRAPHAHLTAHAYRLDETSPFPHLIFSFKNHHGQRLKELAHEKCCGVLL